MTLLQLKTKADAKLLEFWDALAIKQEAFHLKHGRYFQLIVTDPVVDGVDTTFVLKHPNDETHVIDVDFTFNSPIPFEIRVDTWGNVPTRGYRMTATIELPDGRKFARSRSLTDTRTITQDMDNTDPENPVPVGDRYYAGDTPVIATSNWNEVIDETI